MLVLLRSRRRLLPLLASLARRGRTARVRLPFPLPPEAPAALGEKVKEPERSRPDGTTFPLRVGGCLAPHWRRWQAIGAESWVVTVLRDGYCVPSWTLLLPYLAPRYRFRRTGQALLGLKPCGKRSRDACQRSLRNRPRSGSRLLQSSFPGGEGVWRLETRDRSLSPERVRPADSIQDGNSRFCTVICQRGGFSSFPGSERRVLSDPDPSIFEEAIEVHVGGDGLPVPSTVFQTVDCSPGLYQGLRGRVSVGTHSRDQTSPLPGRLVGSLLLGVGSQAGRPVAPLALSHPRDCDKREEVGSRALADCEVSRHDLRYRGRQGFSVSGASREIPDVCGELLFHGRSPSSALSGDPWSPGFARAAGPSRSPSDAHFTVASEGALVPRVRPSLSSSALATGSETGPVLVDGEGSSLDGGSIRDTCAGSSPVFGRVLFGMGRSPSRSTRVRGVVRPGEVAAHQSSRNEGSFLRPSGIPRTCHRSSRDSDVRQLDSHDVRQQARGHGFPGSMLVGQPPSEMDREFRHPSRCEVSTRTSQCPGRCPQLSRASSRDRVVSPPSGGEVTASCLGQSVDRPLCDVPQRETAPVLLASPGSPGRLRGCVSPSLGRPGPVRVPSLSSGRSGDRPCLRVVAGCDDSGRTPLAREVDLLLLLTQPPLALSWWDSLLRQPHCNLFHQGIHTLNLHVWRLSSVISESRAFREGLLESCQGASDPPPRAYTS